MLHAAALLLCAASLDQALPAVRKIADGSGATIGVSAVHIESGCRMSLRGDQPFPMQSVYKVAIAVHVLRRGVDLDSVVTLTKDDIRLGVSPISDLLRAHPERPVTRTVRELLQSAVQISDNAASDAVLRIGGGPKAVMATLRELHVAGINVTESEGDMAKRFFSQPIARYLVDANNTSTPNGMTDLLVAIQSGRAASPESTRLLLKWMTDTTTGANRLRAVLGVGQGQEVAAAQVDEEAEEVHPHPRRDESAGARSIDHTGTNDDHRKVVRTLVLPEQGLLAQLGLRVDVAPSRLRLQRRLLVEPGTPPHPVDAVDAEGGDEHDLRPPPRRHDRVEELLRGDHAVQEQIGGGAADTGGQVVDHVHVLDRARAVVLAREGAENELDARGRMTLEEGLQTRAAKARPDEELQLRLAVGQETLDDRSPEEAAGARDQDLHDDGRAASVIASCLQISSMIQDTRMMSR